jgi:hypothetical protein
VSAHPLEKTWSFFIPPTIDKLSRWVDPTGIDTSAGAIRTKSRSRPHFCWAWLRSAATPRSAPGRKQQRFGRSGYVELNTTVMHALRIHERRRVIVSRILAPSDTGDRDPHGHRARADRHRHRHRRDY